MTHSKTLMVVALGSLLSLSSGARAGDGAARLGPMISPRHPGIEWMKTPERASPELCTAVRRAKFVDAVGQRLLPQLRSYDLLDLRSQIALRFEGRSKRKK